MPSSGENANFFVLFAAYHARVAEPVNSGISQKGLKSKIHTTLSSISWTALPLHSVRLFLLELPCLLSQSHSQAPPSSRPVSTASHYNHMLLYWVSNWSTCNSDLVWLACSLSTNKNQSTLMKDMSLQLQGSVKVQQRQQEIVCSYWSVIA